MMGYRKLSKLSFAVAMSLLIIVFNGWTFVAALGVYALGWVTGYFDAMEG